MRRLIRAFAAVCGVLLSSHVFAAAIDLPAIADTYTQSDSPTAAFGSNGIIAVSGTRTSLIRFNAQSIAAAPGTTATLKVKVLTTKNAANMVTVRLIQSNWNETSVTYNSRPTVSGAVLAQKTILSADAGQVVTFDISAAVAGWKANPATNFGVAIVAGAPTPNLGLGSREGGAAAVLSLDGAPAATNHVTVAPSGGNYTNPVAAASNALTGDHWCVSPRLPASPCVMNIAAGIYILPSTLFVSNELSVVGASKEETVLVAAKGVTTAVASAAASMTDLSIVNNQDGDANANGIVIGDMQLNLVARPTLSRVSVAVSGGFNANGIVTRDFATFNELDVSVHGSGGLTGLDLKVPANCTRCSITAVGEFATGVRQEPFSQPIGTTLDQSTVTVLGGNSAAIGVEFTGFKQGGTVKNSTIIARGNVGVRAVTSHEATGAVVLVLDSTLIADSPGAGVGFEHNAESSETTLDGVAIRASSDGVQVVYPAAATVHIMRSQITAGRSALQASDFHVVDISGSLLHAPKWLTGTRATVTAADSVLDGLGNYSLSQVTCTRVYDSAYHLSNTCPAQVTP